MSFLRHLCTLDDTVEESRERVELHRLGIGQLELRKRTNDVRWRRIQEDIDSICTSNRPDIVCSWMCRLVLIVGKIDSFVDSNTKDEASSRMEN